MVFIIFQFFVLVNIFAGVSSSVHNRRTINDDPKLLVIMIDGFRWDYYDRQKVELNAFRQFLSEGVQAQWVDPIFPSLSYPNWMTVSTGLLAESHGILGNYMLDRGEGNTTDAEFFLLNTTSTAQPRWWTKEPIWTTATKNNRKVSLANWGRCDVPFDNVSPAYCTGYKYTDVSTQLRENLQTALKRLKTDCQLALIHVTLISHENKSPGIHANLKARDLKQVYDDLVDHAGHAFGPDSNELKFTLGSINQVLQEFDFNIRTSPLKTKLNVIILSDHGMTNIKKDSSVQYVFIGEYVNTKNVYKVVDYGAVVSIAAVRTPTAIDELMKELDSMPGVNAYKREDIPEEFHYKNNRLTADILLVARQGYSIVGLKGDKQMPENSKSSEEQPYLGNHGYYNSTDMRGIFFARGPAFKKGLVHSPIRMEDSYQVFAHILDIPAMPNNGSWARVMEMMSDL